MARKPRDPRRTILPRSKLLWLAFVGAVMGGTTLGVLAWADDHYNSTIARTMGMTSFAIANLLLLVLRARRARSRSSASTCSATASSSCSPGLSVLAIVLAPQLNLFNRILDTVPLTLHQWLICIVAALAAVVVTEIRKFVLRRGGDRAEAPLPSAPEPASP